MDPDILELLLAQQDATANPSNTQGGGVIDDGSLGLLGLGLDLTPGVGDAKALLHDAPRDFREGHPISGTVAALSAVPILGIPLDVARKLPINSAARLGERVFKGAVRAPGTIGRAIGDAGSAIGDAVGGAFSALGRKAVDTAPYVPVFEDAEGVTHGLLPKGMLMGDVDYITPSLAPQGEDFFNLPGTIAKSQVAGRAFDREMNILNIDDLFPDDVAIRAAERAGVPRLLAQNPVIQGPQSADEILSAYKAEIEDLRLLDKRIDASIARGATGPGNSHPLSRQEARNLTYDKVDKGTLERRLALGEEMDDFRRISDDAFANREYANLIEDMMISAHRKGLEEAMDTDIFGYLDIPFDDRVGLVKKLPSVPRDPRLIQEPFKF